MKLEHYLQGSWVSGQGEGEPLHHAITGDIIATHTIEGIDFGEVLAYGRQVGNPALRKMTFRERGLMLKKLALFLHERRKSYYPISYQTGATKIDSWIDIDGGIGTLFAYASLRRQLPDEPFAVDGQLIKLSKENTFIGHHIMVPRDGIAIHINAFNFPIWGMLEKISVNLLAGMPAVVKPAEQTAYLTVAMVKDIIASGILPEGALQLIAGYGNGLLDHVSSQDVVTFTGSASTGKKLKTHPRIIEEAVSFNMEADSLNCSVLGPNATPDTEEFKLFIKEVRKEMTVKAGQKCTAIRRVIVPEALVEDVQIALGQQLAKVSVGDPQVEGVRMGALISKEQVEEVRQRIKELRTESELVFGNPQEVEVTGADAEKGAFISPVLLLQKDPLHATRCHEVEAFGPVSTLMPYNDLEEAIALSKMGKGSLVSSIATYDQKTARAFTLGAASHHGRILIINRDMAAESTGHGSPMPMLNHGGPGRAGGGSEMGGLRGLHHYLQTTAIQGHPTFITAVTNEYQYGGEQWEDDIHPFRKHFEELRIGETYVTAKHTVTEADIVNFANVSGDHFYAHVDTTSLDGTIFEQRVAHGYYLMSKAAGLFVEAKKGPVLLNYGIDECRFTKPVYPGTTIGVRLTVKQKSDQEKRDPEDIAKGIVRWQVEMYDDTDETVMLATILTMVRKLDQGG